MEAVSTLFLKSYSLGHKSEGEINILRKKLAAIAPGYSFQFGTSKKRPCFFISVPRAQHLELLTLAKTLNNSQLEPDLGWYSCEMGASPFASVKPPRLTAKKRHLLDMPLRKIAISDTRVLTGITRGLLSLLHPAHEQDYLLPVRDRFVIYLGDVVAKTWDELMAFPFVGVVGLAELEARLIPLGLGFGMDTAGWVRPAKAVAKPVPPRAVLMQRLDSLPFSKPLLKVFAMEALVYLGDLVTQTEADIWRMHNLGAVKLAEMKRVLDELGCELDMDVPDWPPEEGSS